MTIRTNKQPEYYLITKEELALYHNLVHGITMDHLEQMTNTVLSRPLIDHDIITKENERKTVLDGAFKLLIENRFETELSPNYLVWSADVEQIIESLRPITPAAKEGENK